MCGKTHSTGCWYVCEGLSVLYFCHMRSNVTFCGTCAQFGAWVAPEHRTWFESFFILRRLGTWPSQGIPMETELTHHLGLLAGAYSCKLSTVFSLYVGLIP
jgi:hypothetical protein